MLSIQLGEFSGDNRQLIKNMSNVITKNCEVYGESSLLNPSFLLNYDTSLLNKNYVKVTSWNRYYNIVSPLIMMAGGRCLIKCAEDVRMTYANAILGLDCYIVRNQNKCNTLLVDDYYPAEIMSTLCTLKFNQAPFGLDSSSRSIVLCVYGGSNNEQPE